MSAEPVLRDPGDRLAPGTRARSYLEARRALDDPATNRLALGMADALEFWRWYASMIRPEAAIRIVPAAEEPPPFPEPNGQVCLWFSGGAESTFTLRKIEHLQPTLLCYEDFASVLDPYRGRGQVHLLLASVSAGLGYSVAYLGVERNDLLIGRNPATWPFVERSAQFIEEWNRHHPGHRLRTCCGSLHKEEIVAALLRWEQPFSSCDRRSGGWCRDCFKCFEAYYSARAMGLDIGYRLTRRVFEQIHDREYVPYVASGFRTNPFNALQYFVRLQISYGLVFDPDADCE